MLADMGGHKSMTSIDEILAKFQPGDAAKIEALGKDLEYLVRMGDLDGYDGELLGRLQEAAVLIFEVL